MKRKELELREEALFTNTHDALQMVVDELNKGQRKKIVKNPEVKALLDRYGVNYE